MFEHYVITRFNVFTKGWRTTHADVIDKEWQDNKIHFFKKYALPSVRNQICKNFKYIVLVNHLTKQEYIDYFKSIDVVYDVVICKNKELYRLDAAEFIENDTDKEYIMTSVLDVDDIILDDYIYQLQKSFIPEEDVCIDVSVGYIYDFHKKRMWRCYRSNNQFVNLIEKSPLKTCYYRNHQTNRENFKIIYNFEAQWIYVKHKYSETMELDLRPDDIPSDVFEIKDNKLRDKYVLY
jgi:hypothetical protein